MAHRHRQKFAVLFLDLDRFKDINDMLGHDAGDTLLKETATGLQGCVREVDTVARVGGDEFTIILTDIDLPGSAEVVAKKGAGSADPAICAQGGRVLYRHKHRHSSDGEDSETLVRNADTAMYQAKQTRNVYHFYTS